MWQLITRIGLLTGWFFVQIHTNECVCKYKLGINVELWFKVWQQHFGHSNLILLYA